MNDGSLHDPDEETPLLDTNPQKQRSPTPLPRLQIAIVFLMQVCEPLTSQSIYPYINQLISELDITGGDERKVGYYAGLIESLFFVTEAITVLQWSRASDHIGRKPIILIGLLGTTLSMLAFGLSRTFWTLVLSRCLNGLLNGNIGVMKSVMGEITDSTNRAQGFSLMPLVWGFGGTVGPLIGGSLYRPHERFSRVFSGSFWKEYPYFLPCLATSTYVFFAFVIGLFLFKETVPRRNPRRTTAECCEGPKDGDPVPLRELLVYPVVISISNFVFLAFLNIAFTALFPLFLAMPLEIGGLNLSPPIIGYIIGSSGGAGAIFQAIYFPSIVRRWGERTVFIVAMSLFLPIFLLFPIINIVARGWGQLSFGVCILLGILLIMVALMDLAYGVIFMYITASAPNKRSLGATNGLSQMMVSISRAIGPAMSTSLFSFSVENNIFGGFGVYVFFAILTVLSLRLATRLPSEMWEQHEPELQVEHSAPVD